MRPTVTQCTLTFRFSEYAFQRGATQDLWVIVEAEQGSGVTVEVSPRGGFVDPVAANDTATGDLPVR